MRQDHCSCRGWPVRSSSTTTSARPAPCRPKRRLSEDIAAVSRAEEGQLDLHLRPVSPADADTAEGIAPEHLPHLFERFYRADPARDRAHGGSGIGLAIVRADVTAHGGRVSADSPGPGHGARFVIVLPRRDR